MKTKLLSIGCMALALWFHLYNMPRWAVFVALLFAVIYWIYNENEPTGGEPNYEL